MNTSSQHPPFSVVRSTRPRRAFALVITLLILSLLVVVAVSYLSSMVGEHQTADAYTSETRAEEMAQAGADSAMAVLKEAFRDFPDSATAWDTAQSSNTDGVPGNEGTNLYLRAVPDANGYANPFPLGTPTPDNPIGANANAAGGNDPNNPACKNFVLPLISGVPNGRAQLVSSKANIFTKGINATATDSSQNGTDLNVRRGKNDMWGVIGSPPSWSNTYNYPKPARAYWVPVTSNVKDANGNAITTGRYAFWIEDESFRVNDSYFGDTTQPGMGIRPPDNQSQPVNGTTPRSLQPADATLLGPLTLIGDATASDDAKSIFNTRTTYPGKFFPDPLSFAHALPPAQPSPSPAFSFAPSQADLLRYFMTNQSGALNLTRHGTQRLNLNGVLTAATTQAQVDQIVQTLKFHLPYFGERFYRTNAASANDATPVSGSPVLPVSTANTNSNIYCYKVAANLLDYVDTDSQPTIIDATGKVLTSAGLTYAMNDGVAPGTGPSDIWAEGKEGGPFLQEAAVRYRPVAYDHLKPNPPLQFDLQIDYYLEYWNMTDRDIYASAAPAKSNYPSLGGAKIRVHNQHPWKSYPSGGAIMCSGANPNALTYRDASTDEVIDLSGVIFKAGSCTVITTDPNYMTYKFVGPPGAVSMPASSYPSVNTAVTYLCPVVGGQRDYTGTIQAPDYGIQESFRNTTTGSSKEDDEVQVILANGNGYIDSTLFAISEHGAEQWTGTDKYLGQPGNYDDYSYSSCLFGNFSDSQLSFAAVPSELGDPRTNNEQLNITLPYDPGKAGDQTRFIYGSGADTTLGYPNPSQRPDQGNLWGDYYALPTPSGGIVAAPDATTAPTVVANAPLTSIGQLGDVFDPARTAGPAGIVYSRGGGRTFKIGQHDDRYSSDPGGSAGYPNYDSTKPLDYVPASNGWASWRLMDVFDATPGTSPDIESPARVNINGVLRDQGAALLALFQGFVFQPSTSPGATSDPIIHGDGHGSAGLASQALNATSFSVLVNQIETRLTNQLPANGPMGPFFERGELGELGNGSTTLFGQSPPVQYAPTNKTLVSSVDMNKTFDHSREELVRRVAQMICTRGDTFTVYAVGQSIAQPSASAPLKITGTHRTRLTFRLVPKNADGTDFHPGYTVDSNSGAVTQITNTYTNSDGSTNLPGTKASGRFAKPDHYDTQVLQTSTY